MSEFKKKLRAVFDHGRAIEDIPIGMVLTPTKWRYVPRSLGKGYGWGVFDRGKDRLLTDKEVKALPLGALASEEFTQ